MLKTPTLHNLLEMTVPGNFQPLLIYAEKRTERLTYVCGFIFGHVLRLQADVTTDKEVFESFRGIKINYSDRHFEHAFQVLPQGLLDESGIRPDKPVAFVEKDMLYFYREKGSPHFSFDIFSAVFYFISRYEEWQAFEADSHGRFETNASLLFAHKFHLRPVVDHWIQELQEALKNFYPAMQLPERNFRVISTIDIDNLYAYRAKGFLRTAGAAVKDLLKGDLKNLRQRIQVLRGRQKDPFDIYASVSDFCFEKKIPLLYFFLFRTGTAHDRTVDPHSPVFEEVFNTIRENHAHIGLHPSYEASVDKTLLAKERALLNKRLGESVTLSRQHYLRFKIRSTPAELIDQGFEADFSMGFASAPGFRAGTSHPFYYYDFEREAARNLLFVPFCVMDGVYTVYKNLPPDRAYTDMLSIAEEVKATRGIFISVFHERSFSDHLYNGFGTLYKNLHSALKDK